MMAESEETKFRPKTSTLIAAGAVVAATYFYFLIFAEFALLELGAPFLADGMKGLRGLMFCLGGGGVVGSVLAAWRFDVYGWQEQLRWALSGCAMGAVLALGAGTGEILFLAAGISGLSLGALTVILAAGLRPTIGTARLGWVIGWGTGLAYAVCNVPAVFESSARAQAGLAAVVITGAVMATLWLGGQEPSALHKGDYAPTGVVRWVGLLLMLVWLDSAVFYVIQHQEELQQDTWSGTGALWANATIHLLLAVGAGWVLDRGIRVGLLVAGFGLLVTGTLMLGGGAHGGAGLVYAAGVSLYSVVLVYYPARSGRAGVAGWVYGIAGWVGSAMGIGMAQDLSRVPIGFLVVSAGVIGVILVWRAGAMRRAVLIVGLGLMVGTPDGWAALSGPEIRGREVYIAEGCIHCHSQYIRPGTGDEARWGEPRPVAGTPPLLGNRRQGPDLSTVGLRWSREWQREHLMAPRRFKPRSRMPSYAYLFSGDTTRGEDLVAYLLSLGNKGGRE